MRPSWLVVLAFLAWSSIAAASDLETEGLCAYAGGRLQPGTEGRP